MEKNIDPPRTMMPTSRGRSPSAVLLYHHTSHRQGNGRRCGHFIVILDESVGLKSIVIPQSVRPPVPDRLKSQRRFHDHPTRGNSHRNLVVDAIPSSQEVGILASLAPDCDIFMGRCLVEPGGEEAIVLGEPDPAQKPGSRSPS